MNLDSINGIIITFGVVFFAVFLALGMSILQKAYAEESLVSVSPWMPAPYKWNQPPAVCLYGDSHENDIGEQAVKEWQNELRNYTGLNDSWNLRVVKFDSTTHWNIERACNIEIHYWPAPNGYEFDGTTPDIDNVKDGFTKQQLIGITMMRDLPQNCAGYGIIPDQENTCLMKNWDHSWIINLYDTNYWGNGASFTNEQILHSTEHELGHAFGIYEHYAFPSIMSDGFNHIENSHIQKSDLDKIIKIYGDDWQ